MERSFYVTRGEKDSVAAVDAELARFGVDSGLVETLGGARASAVTPKVEHRGPGRPPRGRD